MVASGRLMSKKNDEEEEKSERDWKGIFLNLLAMAGAACDLATNPLFTDYKGTPLG